MVENDKYNITYRVRLLIHDDDLNVVTRVCLHAYARMRAAAHPRARPRGSKVEGGRPAKLAEHVVDVAVCRGAGGPVVIAITFYAKACLLWTKRWQNETACTGETVS